ncbi:MAG: PRTRC system protein C [Candidatus Promineifilaceae bacterium]
MTTANTIQPTRLFKYASQSFPDPGAQYSVEDVLSHLKAFFPELGNAQTEQTTRPDGTVEITFSKQVTRKSVLGQQEPSLAAESGMNTLVSALAQADPFANPLEPVYAALANSAAGHTQALTLATIRQHSQLLHDNTELLQIHTAAIQQLVSACQQIPPTPLHSLPLGF